jgi:hypothetical protein
MGRTADFDPPGPHGSRAKPAPVADPYPGEEEPTKPCAASLILPAQWNAAYWYLTSDAERKLFLDLLDAWLDASSPGRARAAAAWFLHTRGR